MRLSRRISQVLLAGFLGIGLVLGLAGPAAAADGWERAENSGDFSNGYEKSCIPAYKVTVCWQPYGEHFWIRDEIADGVAVAVDWEFHSYSGGASRYGVIYNNHGKDAGWTHKNKSFGENNLIGFRACTVTSIANRDLGTCSEWEWEET